MPVGVTPELMCDWDWMVDRLADMHPLFEPGTRSVYMAYTFGWVVGEVVRRTDPKQRPFGSFIQEENCQPLGIDSLWAGIPLDVESRVAKLTDMPPIGPGAPGISPDSLRFRATPPEVATAQAVFGRSDVRLACIPGAQGIMKKCPEPRPVLRYAGQWRRSGWSAFVIGRSSSDLQRAAATHRLRPRPWYSSSRNHRRLSLRRETGHGGHGG